MCMSCECVYVVCGDCIAIHSLVILCSGQKVEKYWPLFWSVSVMYHWGEHMFTFLCERGVH